MTPGSDRVLDRLTALHPKVIDLSLGRIERLLAALGHPERRLPSVVHVAGTNGKGSVVAMLRAGLEASGARVHVYTSPHLARFHERIRIAGALIDEDALVALLERCEAANAGAPITFFEITTAAAFLAMAETPADFALLEVGLGGRLDATNVVEAPRLSVVTPVSLDHQQYLGETLAEIAAEKAGILKPGVACLVGHQAPEALAAIEARAAAVGAPLAVANRDWQVWEEHGRMAFLDEAACAAAVTRAEWPARLQRLRHGPLVDAAGAAELWLDGGHNPAAGEALAEALSRLPPRRLHLVCGMLNTKDVEGFLRPLAGEAVDLAAVTIPGEAATLPAEATAAAARAVGLPAAPAAGVAEAVAAGARDPGARILICGSLYLAGQVLRANG